MGSYTVEHLTSGGSPTITDISGFANETKATFYSDGRINTGNLTLRAQGGAFKTNTNGGTTPIINNFDRIRLTFIDAAGNSYQHIFEVINDLNQLSNQAEYLLPLTLEGRERALAQIPFSGFYDTALNHYQMVERILLTYSAAYNPTGQPLIATTGNLGEDTNLLPPIQPKHMGLFIH